MEPYQYDKAVVAAVEAELAGIYSEVAKLKDDPYVEAASTAGSAALAVTLGFVGAVGTTAALPLIISTMGIAAGFAGLGLATAQLFAAVTGSKTVVNAETEDLLGLAGSPFQLGGAAVGAIIDGNSGLKRAIEVGKAVDAVYAIGSGLREYLKESNDKGMIDIAQGLIGLSQLEPSKIFKPSNEQKKSEQKRETPKPNESKEDDAETRERAAKARAQEEAQVREQKRLQTEREIASAAAEMRARQQAEQERRARAEEERQRRLKEERKALEEKERRRAEELKKRREEEEEARKKAQADVAAAKEEAKKQAEQAAAAAAAAGKAAADARAQREDRQRSGAGYGGGGGGSPSVSGTPSLRLP